MRIGELAKQSGLTVDTLRYYEKEGDPRPCAVNPGIGSICRRRSISCALFKVLKRLDFPLKSAEISQLCIKP